MLPVGALRQCDDPDGWTRFTQAEQRTMMTLWCMMRSPLMVGAELTRNDEFTLNLLTNRAVLDIGKGSFCAHPLYRTESECAWIAPGTDGSGAYVALFNLSDEERDMSVPAETIEMEFASARELWTGTYAKDTNLTARLPAHDAAVWFIGR